jgi:hypothetical protein
MSDQIVAITPMNNPNPSSNNSYAAYSVLAEILFVMLPIIVLFLVKLKAGTIAELLTISDWAFGTVVLFGQSIVKFASGLVRTQKRSRWQFVAFVISALIVFGVVPACTIIVLPQSDPPVAFR